MPDPLDMPAFVSLFKPVQYGGRGRALRERRAELGRREDSVPFDETPGGRLRFCFFAIHNLIFIDYHDTISNILAL